MKQHHPSFDKLESYLQIYALEPIGWILKGKLDLPISLIYFFFFFLYFGVMLWLNINAGVPLPSSIGQLVRFSFPTQYYYPNLNSIAADVIGHPLVLVVMIVFREYIPKQFRSLQKDHLIKEKDGKPLLVRYLSQIILNPRAQTLIMQGIPVVSSVIAATMDFELLKPNYPPALYAVFLSALGKYAQTVVIVQLLFIFLIFSNCSLTMDLNIVHPDRCGGLSPFGNLAIATYLFLLFNGLLASFGTYGGVGPYAEGSAFIQFTLKDLGVFGQISSVFFVLLYPLTIVIVIDQLLYGPHSALENYRQEYLKNLSIKWTKNYERILENLDLVVGQPRSTQNTRLKEIENAQIENFDKWLRLEKYILDMHTWPIPKSVLGFIAVFLNPITPLLIPLFQEIAKLFH